MLSLSEAARISLEKLFRVSDKENKYVIYPFGEGGKILKGILNYEYGVFETAIIDNGLAQKNSNIEKISYLKEHQDVIVLISSNRLDLYNIIRQQLYENISPERCVEVYEEIIYDERYYSEILRLSRIYSADRGLVRVGNANDGGYLMVDDMLGGIAYSFGISNDPSWDLGMYKLGYEVYMYDHTVDAPSEIKGYKDKMHFFKLGIADRCVCDNLKTLDELIKRNGHERERDMILKMDVEGAEWGFLEMVSSETLARFRQIVFELHNMNLADDYKIAALSKLYETHRVVHIHGNNYGGYISIYSHNIPDTWEVTYLRNDFVGKMLKNVSLPVSNDRPCNKDEEEIILGDWNRPWNIRANGLLFGTSAL